MDTKQAMNILEKIDQEERDEANAPFYELFGGKTFKDMFKKLYFEIDVSRMNPQQQADYYKLVYEITKSQLPAMFGNDIAE